MSVRAVNPANLSFGNSYDPDLNDPRRGSFSTGTSYNPAQRATYSVGTPVVAAPRTATPTRVVSPTLSFDKSIGKIYTGPSAVPASYPGISPMSNSKASGFGASLSDFLATASTGILSSDTRNNPAVYDDGPLRQVRVPTAIPTQVPAQIGNSFNLDKYKGIAKSVLGMMGSSGDGDVVPVSYGAVDQASIDPVLIGVGALAVGAVIYAVTR